MEKTLLKTNYVNWLKSKQVLSKLSEKYENKKITTQKIKTLLENALMYLLLYEKYKGDDFFDQIEASK